MQKKFYYFNCINTETAPKIRNNVRWYKIFNHAVLHEGAEAYLKASFHKNLTNGLNKIITSNLI